MVTVLEDLKLHRAVGSIHGQLTTIFARGRRVHRFSGYPKALSEDLPELI